MSQKMATVEKHYDFLTKVAKAKGNEAEKLIQQATNEQIEAIQCCILMRKLVTSVPITKSTRKVVNNSTKRKRIRQFLIKHHRILKAIIACVLVRLAQESLIYVCDSL